MHRTAHRGQQMSDLAARIMKERQETLDRLAVLDRGGQLRDRGVLDADSTPLTDPVDEARALRPVRRADSPGAAARCARGHPLRALRQ